MSKDDFTNQTLMHLILNLILKNNQHYIYQYDAFWCQDGGYNIIELANAGTMHDYFIKYGVDNIINACKQIMSVLSLLKSDQYSFIHADLKAKNIFVNVVNNVPTFKIADYDKSSITWHGYRFYNGTNDYGLAEKLGSGMIKDGWYQLWTVTGVSYQAYTMYSAYGYYLSYDVYTFFLSLLVLDDVWEWFTEWLSIVHPTKYVHDGTSIILDEDSGNELIEIFKLLFKHEELIYLISYLIDYPDIQKKFDSLSTINATIQYLQLHFLYNIDNVYRMFGVDPPEIHHHTNKVEVISSTSGRVCASKCDNGTCITPKYSKMTTSWGVPTKQVYDWDYCTIPSTKTGWFY